MTLDFLQVLEKQTVFNRAAVYDAMRQYGMGPDVTTLQNDFQRLLDGGKIVRVSRNAYCIPKAGVMLYEHSYSSLAKDIARCVTENHPYLKFTILELTQFNEFVNHQLAHNVVFLAVEGEIMEFVFDTLKEKFPGKVLLNPTPQVFHQYWSDGMIVIVRLITEAPKGQRIFWHTRIEKLLVDLLTEPLLQESIGESEYRTVYEDAFERYVIDESCLFRYAKRRSSKQIVERFIKEQTDIQLKIKR